MKHLEKIKPHVTKNAPTYTGVFAALIVFKLAFLAGGLFVLVLQNAKILANNNKNKEILEKAEKKAEAVIEPVKKKTKKVVKKVENKVAEATENK